MTTRPTRSFKKGIRKWTAAASLVAAASGVLVHTLGTNRTATIRRIHIMNNNPASTEVTFGAGLAGAFVAGDLPPYTCIPGFDRIITEDEIPDNEFTAAITASASVGAAAPDNVQVMIEVEEYPGA